VLHSSDIGSQAFEAASTLLNPGGGQIRESFSFVQRCQSDSDDGDGWCERGKAAKDRCQLLNTNLSSSSSVTTAENCCFSKSFARRTFSDAIEDDPVGECFSEIEHYSEKLPLDTSISVASDADSDTR
jgi:hypothetical protein